MNLLAQTILPYVLLYKYWALFFFTFLSSLFIPVPAGTLLVAASAFASQGYFNIWLLLLVAVIANILGDSLCFLIARKYGEKFFDRFSVSRKILNSKNARLIMAKMKHSPGFVIFISRFEVMGTLTVNVVSGLSKVPYKKFLAYESVGSAASVVSYGLIGYLFGDSWEAVNSLIGNFSIIILIVLIISVTLFWKKLLNRWAKEDLLRE